MLLLSEVLPCYTPIVVTSTVFTHWLESKANWSIDALSSPTSWRFEGFCLRARLILFILYRDSYLTFSLLFMQISLFTSLEKACYLILPQITPFQLLKLGHQVFSCFLFLQFLVRQETIIPIVISRHYLGWKAYIWSIKVLFNDRRFWSQRDTLASMMLIWNSCSTTFRSLSTRNTRLVMLNNHLLS